MTERLPALPQRMSWPKAALLIIGMSALAWLVVVAIIRWVVR